LVSPQELFTTRQTLPHGHVQAVLGIIRKLGLAAIICAKRCRERDLVVAMITQRLLDPCSQLATTRAWHTTTLAEELGMQAATPAPWPGLELYGEDEQRFLKDPTEFFKEYFEQQGSTFES
jgi:hypothetical protein